MHGVASIPQAVMLSCGTRRFPSVQKALSPVEDLLASAAGSFLWMKVQDPPQCLSWDNQASVAIRKKWMGAR